MADTRTAPRRTRPKDTPAVPGAPEQKMPIRRNALPADLGAKDTSEMSDAELLEQLQHLKGCPSADHVPGESYITTDLDGTERETGSRVEIIDSFTTPEEVQRGAVVRPRVAYRVIRCVDCGNQFPAG